MKRPFLVDTGPLVAVLDKKDRHHLWAVEQFQAFPPPLLTCEAVLTEAIHIIRRNRADYRGVLGLVEDGVLSVPFDLEAEAATVHALMVQYHDTPMDLADACLVRMAELYPDSHVLTIDSDFHIYRKHGTQALNILMPSL